MLSDLQLSCVCSSTVDVPEVEGDAVVEVSMPSLQASATSVDDEGIC